MDVRLRLPWSPATVAVEPHHIQPSSSGAAAADGWRETLQSAGNQLIGLREIDMVPAADPPPPPTVHQSGSAISPLIGQH